MTKRSHVEVETSPLLKCPCDKRLRPYIQESQMHKTEVNRLSADFASVSDFVETQQYNALNSLTQIIVHNWFLKIL